MLGVLVVSVIASAIDTRVETAVLSALGKPDCAERIYGALDPHFEAQAPSIVWRQWCAQVGALKTVNSGEGTTVDIATTTGRWTITVAFSASGAITGLGAAPVAATTDTQSLEAVIERLRSESRVPGLAVFAVDHGAMIAEAHSGVRVAGGSESITESDVWHLGSDTKAMTGALAGMLVDAGLIRWETTIGEVFENWNDIDPQLRTTRLDDLLSHMSGLPEQVTDWSAKSREGVVHAMLRHPPGPRTFAYSNVGYMTAGLMLERVTNKRWEELMRTKLFTPLGMKSCGFGPPATPGKADQPWGHRGTDHAVPPGPNADNPRAFGPAGTVHCSLADWAAFVTMEMRAAAGEATILSKASAQKAFTATRAPSYGLGWMVSAEDVAHGGSNTTFYALVVALPVKQRAFFAVTNAGEGEEVTAKAMTVLRQRFGK